MTKIRQNDQFRPKMTNKYLKMISFHRKSPISARNNKIQPQITNFVILSPNLEFLRFESRGSCLSKDKRGYKRGFLSNVGIWSILELLVINFNFLLLTCSF